MKTTSQIQFWAGKRCLITGINGFLACNLAKRLVESGALVFGIKREIERIVSRVDLFDLRNKINLFHYDIRDFKSIQSIIKGENIDTIFHVAASAIVNTSTRIPLETIETNIIGTCNVLEAARNSEVERIVVASSDKAYGDHHSNLPYLESHCLRGMQIYDCSKSCTDLIAQTYFFQYKMPIRIVRACNIYGPGDINFSRLIPGTIVRIMEDVPPLINPGQQWVKREYVYVKDVVDAYLTLGEAITTAPYTEMPTSGESAYSRCAYNVGSGGVHVKTTREMIDSIQRLLRSNLKPYQQEKIPSDFIELPDQYLNCDKICTETGWKALINLEEGLKKTVKWYQDFKDQLEPVYRPIILANHFP